MFVIIIAVRKVGEADSRYLMSTFIYTFLLVVIDQVSKYIVSRINSINSLHFVVIDGFFNITYAENEGAAFSILQGKRIYFIIITFVVIIGLVIYLLKENVKGIEKICLILIMAGAIGNLIDRIIHGYVIDFLDFNIFGYDFPIFNVADSYITIGVILFILNELMKGNKKDAGN